MSLGMWLIFSFAFWEQLDGKHYNPNIKFKKKIQIFLCSADCQDENVSYLTVLHFTLPKVKKNKLYAISLYQIDALVLCNFS
jgi:hypothetical protein